MESYNQLDAFPDVEQAMQIIATHSSLKAYVFSNGTEGMIKSSLKSSPVLSQSDHRQGNGTSLLGNVISVDSLKLFKPHSRTYDHLVETVGQKGQPGRVWLVTSNPFDVVGARSAGLNSVWVDRSGNGWTDGLGQVVEATPSSIVGGVDEAIREILKKGV